MKVERAGVIGAGTMGAGIAHLLRERGAEVWLVEPQPAAQARARATLARLEQRSRSGPAAGPATTTPALHWLADVAELPESLDVVIEAVPERESLKRTVLRSAAERGPRLLGTNTSALSIDTLAAALPDPSALVGVHFFNPVWAMPLLEIVRGPRTDPRLVEAALELAAQLGKEPIVVADVPGFATSRLGLALGLEAMRMLEDGVASAADLDKAMVLGYRHPMGPLRLTDLIGLDVRLEVARTLHRAYGERFVPPQILLDKVARNELGRKTGRGFFDWPEEDVAGSA